MLGITYWAFLVVLLFYTCNSYFLHHHTLPSSCSVTGLLRVITLICRHFTYVSLGAGMLLRPGKPVPALAWESCLPYASPRRPQQGRKGSHCLCQRKAEPLAPARPSPSRLAQKTSWYAKRGEHQKTAKLLSLEKPRCSAKLWLVSAESS